MSRKIILIKQELLLLVRSEERFSRNAETDLVCRLLLEKKNMDWQHLIMNGENLAEYAALLYSEGKLGHQHANSGWGSFDYDNMVGAAFLMQTMEMSMTLQDVGYGSQGERIGYDLYPYTEDQVAAVRRSVLQSAFFFYLSRNLGHLHSFPTRRSSD